MSVDHTCPTAWAADHGFLAGSPMTASWCLSDYRSMLLASAVPDVMAPELLLWESGDLSVRYAPIDWVNTTARVMLVGITPGLRQATEILREAVRCLRAGYSDEDALRSANAVGSFSGPMRANLVSMLDGVGVPRVLGIDSTARFFDSEHGLAAHVSAISYPVFVRERNYGGASPPLARHPALRALVKASLGARVAMTPGAIVVPLGKAAESAVQLVVSEGLLDANRCLFGVPHPSGANGSRAQQYAAHRATLVEDVVRLFGSPRPGM